MARRTFVPRLVVSSLLFASSACGSTDAGSSFDLFDTGGGNAEDTTGFNPGLDGFTGDGPIGGPDSPAPCVNLQCRVHSCPGGGSTTISGTVYDPAAKNPLYNIVVYIPNAPVQPLKNGASCDSCGSLYSGSPLVATLTDAAGKFQLAKVPDGTNIPLVIQVGKWRKQITIPNVNRCADNALPDKSLTLPKNHVDPGNDIPEIAISTGGADTLECLLRRIGLQESEYGPGTSGTGRIHIFVGSGTGGGTGNVPNTAPPSPRSFNALWDTQADLMKYDLVLLSCEGHETTNVQQQHLFDYAAAGGRVFASHFHYAWFNTGPFGAQNLATWHTGSHDTGDIMTDIVTALWSGAPFPKGVALKQWLGNVGALTGGQLPLTASRHNADVSAANTHSQPWIVADKAAPDPGATEYFTFNTPFGVAPDKQCGRVVYSDLHVGAASGDYGGGGGGRIVPTGCANADLSPQEKALEFMLFDLSSCVTPDDTPPVAPDAGGIH